MVPHRNILIVAAHPDDEILGCGAAIARLTEEGARATTLILGEGITSRGGEAGEEKNALRILKDQSKKANQLVGVKEVVFFDFPDNRFDTVPRLDIIRAVEGEIERLRPDTIFTHHGGDLNVDHQITYEAVLTAARPLPKAPVKSILSFEVLSSTEWGGNCVPFSPRVYIDISSTLEVKIRAMESYKGEIRDFPHPRSKQGIEALARRRGAEAGLWAAEAFEVVRWIV